MRHSHRHRDFSRIEIPLSQLNRNLSVLEESGTISQSIGLLPSRTRQASAATQAHRDPRNVAFVHPPLRANVPLPSASRPAPQRPKDCA